jgi:hypothetical protein
MSGTAAAATQLLSAMTSQVHGMWSQANHHLVHSCRWDRRRNELAEQAARDHRNKAEDLLNNFKGSAGMATTMCELRELRDLAEKWEKKFIQWSCSPVPKSGHVNEYAARIHGEAAQW